MAVAQKNASAALIVDKVDDGQLTMLRGNTLPVANAQNDVGRVSSNLAMKDLILVLKRSPEQQAAFDAFVASQYDSTSPKFHQWLEPAEIGEKFGPSMADIGTISSWLSGHGFSVDEVSKDRMTIRFGGTARQVESAFHTQIHNLTVNGEQHIANMSDPQIPMALEPAVAGVKSLHNFFPRPLHRLGSTVTRNRDTGKWERTPGAPTVATGIHADALKLQPNLGITTGTGSNTQQIEDVTPYDFAAIYNVLPLWKAATPIDGTGQTIAIAATSKILQADVTSFRSIFGLPAGPAPQMVVGNAFDPGVCTDPGTEKNPPPCTINDQTENALDVEWAGAVAKGAQIVLVASGYNSQTNPTNDAVYDSSSYVIQHNTAKILNVSYGLCELGMGTAGNVSYNALWQSAAAQGIAVFVASGDSGSPACDQGQSSFQGVPYGAQFGLAVSGLASTPYNTAVGGTDFDWGSTAAPYWGTTNSTTNGSNALGYVPEIPWNDTCTNPLALSYFQGWATQLQKAGYNPTSPIDGESACNFVATWYQTIYTATSPNNVDLSGFVDSVGAGGGASNCTTGDGATVASCAGGYAKPTWQAGVTGIPSDSKRDIPDVSFFASPGFLGSAYLVCVSGNGACVTSTSSTQSEPIAQEIGGTSAASPAMAGVMALINQKAGTPQGNPNSELYTLAGKQTYSSCKTEGPPSNGCYFNDVDTGTIAMACTAGKPNCTVSHSGDTFGVLSGYNGAAGFDLATGLGSLNVANVVNGWTSAIGTGTSTVTVVPASSSIVSNVALTVTGTVTGTLGTPTGTVTLTGGGYTSSATALSTGAYSITIPANSLSAGSDTLTVTYSGDPTYAIASGTAVVTVTAPPTPTVTVTPASSSIAVGQTLSVTIKVAGSGATPTGTVVLSSGTFASATKSLDATGSVTFALLGNTLAVGTDTLSAKYSGDTFYGTSTGTSSVTVTASAYSLAASQPAASIAAGGSASSTVTLTSTTFYTGTVTLTCALTTSPAGATKLPTCSATSPGTITVAAGTPAGTATINVTTAAAIATLVKPKVGGWAVAGEGAMLALLAFLGIPARRRSWRAMLGVLALTIVLGSLAACGGGGGGGGGGGTPGTTAGAYTFTVTGTGVPVGSPVPNAPTFTVTVN